MGNKARIEYVIDGKNKTKKVFSEVNSDLLKSGNNVKGFNQNMNTGVNTMKRYSAVIGTAVVASTALFIKKTMDMADGLAKMSQKVGVSVENLSTLQHAAKLSGTSIDGFEKAIAKQSRGLLDTTLGIKEAADAYNILGIAYKDNEGKLRETDAVMMDVADRFSVMEDGGKKTALAMKLFGRSGTDLIPMLNQGSEGIKAMQQEARDLGLEIGTKTAHDAERFNDSLTRLEANLTGLAYTALPAVVESLSWLTENFVGGIEKITGVTAEVRGELERLTRKRYVVAWEFSFESYDKETLRAEAELIKKELDEIKNSGTIGGLLAWAGIDTDSNNADIAKIKELEDQLSAITNIIEDKRTSVEELNNTSVNGVKSLTKESIKLSNEWQKQSQILQNDIIKNGLSPQSAKLFDLQTKADQLKVKYAGVAGAVKLINEHLQSAIEKELKGTFTSEFENVNVFEDKKVEAPQELMFQDTTAMDAYYDHMIERSIEVTDLEMMNYALQTGAANMAFGNMGQAMQIFYEMGGQKAGLAFTLMKGFTIAEIGMSTYLSAMAALSPPPVGLGPVWGWALAGTIGVLGAAKAAQVAGLQPGNSGGGGGMSRPSISLPSSADNRSYSSNTDNSSRNVNITINTDGNGDTDRYIRDELLPGLKLAFSDGYDLDYG